LVAINGFCNGFTRRALINRLEFVLKPIKKTLSPVFKGFLWVRDFCSDRFYRLFPERQFGLRRNRVVVRIAATLAIVSLILGMFPQAVDIAQGAYSTSTTDADGNAHLGSNTVNDTYYYDTTQDSNAATQQQLGVDPNWKSGVVRKSYAHSHDGGDYSLKTGVTNLTSVYTAELWFKPTADITSATSCQTLFTLRDASAGADFAYVPLGSCAGALSNEVITVAQSSGDGRIGVPSITITGGVWHHLAIVWNAKSARYEIYLDGTLQSIDTAGTPALITPNVIATGALIGSSAASAFFSGQIDELHLSGVSRYSANFSPPPGWFLTNSQL